MNPHSSNRVQVSKLELSVQRSAAVIIFLSKGYFASVNCRRELNAAIAHAKPLIRVHEPDEGKGGASLQELEAECRAHTSRTAARRHTCMPQSVRHVFNQELPIVTWVRVREYQLASLRIIGNLTKPD